MSEDQIIDFDPENCTFTVTEHCLQRYAERVRGLPNAGTDPDGKLTNEVKLLFMSSKCYYFGVIGKGTNSVGVYCNRNGWTFITDEKEKKLITVYKVDLNVDSDEVNQLYVDKALNKISQLSIDYEDAQLQAEAVREHYSQEVEYNLAKIKEYKAQIKALEDRNDAIKNMNITESAKSKVLQTELRQALEDFMIKDKSKIDNAS